MSSHITAAPLCHLVATNVSLANFTSSLNATVATTPLRTSPSWSHVLFPKFESTLREVASSSEQSNAVSHRGSSVILDEKAQSRAIAVHSCPSRFSSKSAWLT